MAFGEALSLASNKTSERLYGKLIGVNDFHSHFRWRGIKQYINFEAKHTLEVGAGTGVMTFEVAKRLPKDARIIASEFNDHSVAIGKEIAKRGHFKNVEFVQKDLRALGLGGNFDQVLAIDVLEHVDDDLLALKEINGVLKSGGLLIISVPTPQKRFVCLIGTLRDGWRRNKQKCLSNSNLTKQLWKRPNLDSDCCTAY